MSKLRTSCDVIAKLSAPNFYKHREFMPAKFSKYKKDYRTDNTPLYSGDLFIIDCIFMHGSISILNDAKLISPTKLLLQRHRNRFSCYQLIRETCA